MIKEPVHVGATESLHLDKVVPLGDHAPVPGGPELATEQHLLGLTLQVHGALDGVLGDVDQEPVVPEGEDDGVHDTSWIRHRSILEIEGLEQKLTVSLCSLSSSVPGVDVVTKFLQLHVTQLLPGTRTNHH